MSDGPVLPTELTQRQLSEIANDRIRDTAKWLVGAFAAVGAALLAGTQISNLGKLPMCVSPPECARIWVAIAGIVVGLGGVAMAIAVAVGIMTQSGRSVAELVKEVKKTHSPLRKYFVGYPVVLQGFKDLDDLVRCEKAAYAEFDRLTEELKKSPGARRGKVEQALQAADDDLADVLARSEAVVSLANQVVFSSYFKRRGLRLIFVGAAAAAVGLGMFAWAANPGAETQPTASMSGADLAGANLSNANLAGVQLTNVNFSGANLTNASLQGSSVIGADFGSATWSNTTCPDGSNSDDVGGSCVNHLTVPSP